MSFVKEYFKACEECFPEKKAELRRISLSLRREGIETMEGLCEMALESSEKIINFRNIGEKSIQLIDTVCMQYKNEG